MCSKRILRVYIAAPFRRMSSKMKNRAYGVIHKQDYIDFLQQMESVLLKAGFEPVLPHRDEGQWGKIYIKPEDIAKICFDLISSSDMVIAIPGRSRGVHAEIGYAAALKKRLIIFLKEGERESIFIPGLGKETQTTVFRYIDEKDIVFRLEEFLLRSKYYH